MPTLDDNFKIILVLIHFLNEKNERDRESNYLTSNFDQYFPGKPIL